MKNTYSVTVLINQSYEEGAFPDKLQMEERKEESLVHLLSIYRNTDFFFTSIT